MNEGKSLEILPQLYLVRFPPWILWFLLVDSQQQNPNYIFLFDSQASMDGCVRHKHVDLEIQEVYPLLVLQIMNKLIMEQSLFCSFHY